MLDITNIKKSINYKITLVTPQDTVEGFVMQEFSFNNDAEYGDSMSMGSDTVNTAFGIIQSARNTLPDQYGGGDASQVLMKGFLQTIAKYQGTTKPSFLLPFLFVADKPDVDVRKDIKSLLKAIYPKNNNGVMEAPFGYGTSFTEVTKSSSSNTGEPLCTLTIGRWFKASQLIIKSVNPTFSKEVIKTGLPLYARADVTMEPYKLPTVEEVLNYLSV